MNDAVRRLLAITTITIIAGIALFFLGSWFFGTHTGYLGKLIMVVRHNTGFWATVFLAFAFGFYRKLSRPNDFSWGELPVQLVASFVVIFLLFLLFFSTSANLTDTEIWNGKVLTAEYEEEWTELVTWTEQVCTGKDSKGNCLGTRTVTHTRHDYHSPSWHVYTTVGDFFVSEDVYKAHRRHFENETKVYLHRSNQISSGDGNKFVVDCLRPGKIVPVSVEKSYVNYLRASDSIRKLRGGNLDAYKKYIAPYPRVHNSPFGPFEINRVITAGVEAPMGWKSDVETRLSSALATLGPKKEVNMIVYLAGTADQSFSHILEEAWVNGKKNDVIVIVGSRNFPQIDFVYIIAWTKVDEFKVNLRKRIVAMKTIENSEAFANAIIEEVSKSPQEGGYKRMRMAELEYLIGDIGLPWWCQVIIVVVSASVCWGVSYFLINN